MNDDEMILMECQRAQAEGREISDGCARAIAAQWHSPGNSTAAFSTTGAIIGTDSLWGDFFLPEYESLNADDKLAADMLGTYLLNAGERGPVSGWSELWVGR
jgi:hypothetical protein